MPYKPAVHRQKLVSILHDIYSDVHIAPLLAFKGGTAAYLFYGLTRGSLDLDFDLLDVSPEKLSTVRSALRLLLLEHGIIKDEAATERGIYFLLAYTGKEPNAPNIKVDVNIRQHGSRYATLSSLGIAMPVMVQEDMFAHKLVAMRERLGDANRDIYDVWFMLKNGWPVNEDIVRLRTNKSLIEHAQDCISALTQSSDLRILHGMGELISSEKEKMWIRGNLVAETISELKLLIERTR